MDYRELLKKYINHVGEEEGTTFLSWDGDDRFTEAEWDELQALEAEVHEDWRKAHPSNRSN
jgi:hypothetical protein